MSMQNKNTKAAKAEEQSPEAKEPNIVWADRDREPPASVSIGMHPTITIPGRQPFHSEFATDIISSVEGFKRFQRGPK
jgi:hypothetical protein